MERVAILGGGVAGLAAAHELERQRRQGRAVEWYLFEASDRLGGTVGTTRFATAEGEYILEDGPDGWVTEKPWAEELAGELGLGGEVIACNEAEKKTYLALEGALMPMPAGMRLMVPENLLAMEESPLFSEAAKAAYRAEPARAAELRAAAPGEDESVASFVRRHFGEEALQRVAAPLLSGIFGGDTEKLSVRAVMAPFVRMEAEFGSLVRGLEERRRMRADGPGEPTFRSLRRGMGSLVEALVKAMPAERLQVQTIAEKMARLPSGEWGIAFRGAGAHGCAVGVAPFDRVLLALPVDATRGMLAPLDQEAAALLPVEASSAVLVTFCWPPERAAAFTMPPGFGFLVPPGHEGKVQLLAATFADQKFPGRAPEGARVVRAFFGGASAEALGGTADGAVAVQALAELRSWLGPLPEPEARLTTVRRWPRSLPQYHVGHLQRVAALEERVARLGGIAVLGNALRGVGVPDLVREARRKAAGTLA